MENYGMQLSEPYKTALVIVVLAVAFSVVMVIMCRLAGGL